MAQYEEAIIHLEKPTQQLRKLATCKTEIGFGVKQNQVNLEHDEYMRILLQDYFFQSTVIIRCEHKDCYESQKFCSQCVLRNQNKKILFTILSVITSFNITHIKYFIFIQSELLQRCYSLLQSSNRHRASQLQFIQQQRFKHNINNKVWLQKYFYVFHLIFNLNIIEDAILCYRFLNQQFFKIKNSSYQTALIKLNIIPITLKTSTIKAQLQVKQFFDQLISKLQQYPEANQCQDQALKLNLKSTQVFNSKGWSLNSLNNLNKWQDAIQCYDLAINLDPKNSEAYVNKGMGLFSKLKSYEQTIQLFDFTISINPNDFLAFLNKGKVNTKISKLFLHTILKTL